MTINGCHLPSAAYHHQPVNSTQGLLCAIAQGEVRYSSSDSLFGESR
ncbi:hypothetical protein IQ229_18520 [Nostoc cf. edaphicum LEGE 07299]|uniref:Uncharacterized protein n=1 Tax=Nostoc cf. edaphicum LEGE 07299 TaxID=2777974 RepID=A0ABR9U2F4_9NOSO|nr:hypothetical protein [Nostoc edaphicum]MBE9106846.1 hypothetical protein [Nostoc cf. edaphicum LEGE 07299]